MPVSDDERASIKKMDESARGTFLIEQLKLIRESSTGPAMNHVAVNDALDRLAVMLEPKPEVEKPALFQPGNMDTPPAARDGTVGNPEQHNLEQQPVG